jgi:hypothetical protein
VLGAGCGGAEWSGGSEVADCVRPGPLLRDVYVLRVAGLLDAAAALGTRLVVN